MQLNAIVVQGLLIASIVNILVKFNLRLAVTIVILLPCQDASHYNPFCAAYTTL